MSARSGRPCIGGADGRVAAVPEATEADRLPSQGGSNENNKYSSPELQRSVNRFVVRDIPDCAKLVVVVGPNGCGNPRYSMLYYSGIGPRLALA